jgi:sensor histidine kinase YesM
MIPQVTQTESGPRSGYWRRIAIVNAIGALTAFGLLGGLASNAPWQRRWEALLASFVYANSVGCVTAFVIPRVLSWSGDRYTGARRLTILLVSIPVLIVLGCAVGSGVLVMLRVIEPQRFFLETFGSLRISFIVGPVLVLAVTAYENLRSRLAATSLALRTKERDEAEARRLAAEAQLASLESRVQPHFLFNTLNSIAALIHEDPASAERVTTQLASLMRSSLDTAPTPLVPLDQELRVVRDYLEIERIRFGERLHYQFEIGAGLEHVPVPRLSLQTLVENSVKYAVSPRREGASILVRAAQSNGRLRLDVEDDGPGFTGLATSDGHGLALLKSRLHMTFGDHAALAIDSTRGRTRVSIDLPIDGATIPASDPPGDLS